MMTLRSTAQSFPGAMLGRHPWRKRAGTAALLLSLLPGPVAALPNASVDSTDRFPFVVEIRVGEQLICSGTVLYPRMVVTSAHCLQQKISWRGHGLYVDSYLSPMDLNVAVIRGERVKVHKVAEAIVSPSWKGTRRSKVVRRFSHDLALIVTEEPIEADIPPNAIAAQGVHFSKGSAAKPLPDTALLVAFGEEDCARTENCDSGRRRFLPVTIKESSYCFRGSRDSKAADHAALWCLESQVLPGDSGGALLIKAPGDQFHFVGVISAQQGLPLELAARALWRRTVATPLFPNFNFITEKAKELGYAR